MGGSAPKFCAALLAAGQSRRFGVQDKLAQKLHGRMLGLHMGQTLCRIPFAHNVVITQTANHPCAAGWREAGFSVAVNARAKEGLGTSVALAAKLASECCADALLVCLADMPFVPEQHIRQMLQVFANNGADTILASNGGKSASPPVLFPRSLFANLMTLKGPEGARALIKTAPTIAIAPHMLADIDTPDQLSQAKAGTRSSMNN